MTPLALYALELLEPAARSLIERCEINGPLYQKRWANALEQARAVVAALDDYRANAATTPQTPE